ncbi:Catenin-beta-like protein [Infundibulicybe gibba]|nr:Catenin-beta-like protein [Infundibulicybe gibba]
MDIDKLFKVPKLPAGGMKRNLPDNPTPSMLKKLKMDTLTPPALSDQTPATRHSNVTLEEVDDPDATASDFAPGGDADYFAEEDDEGRFFGGGLTSEQKEILKIFESSTTEGAQLDQDELSITGIRRTLLRLERALNKNQDQRSKYPNDPSKFIDSEADLDGAIKALLPLAQAPVLAYPELLRSGIVTLLMGLLSHENVDIVIDVVEVIHELTDEDVGGEDNDDTDETAEQALGALIDGLVENSIMELLVDNMGRFNENEESDRQGIFHILGIFENILGLYPNLSTHITAKTAITTWLLDRIQAKAHDENRGYAAELLSILLQGNRENRLQLTEKNGIEILLKVLSQYRRKDPIDAEETEFMENVFDALCSALTEPSAKTLFLAAEGPDLMVLMMKEKRQSSSRSIKTLDHAMSGTSSSAVCDAFIEALGIKILFTAFMGKTTKKQKGNVVPPPSEDIAHILGIISSLFSNIPSDSPGRIRLLTKLLEIRDGAQTRLKMTELEIEVEKENAQDKMEDDEDDWYLRRLEGGLFTLQTVDYILAWLIMEDDGVCLPTNFTITFTDIATQIRTHVLQMLDRKNQSLKDIIQSLQIYHDNVDDVPMTGNEMDDDSPRKKIFCGVLLLPWMVHRSRPGYSSPGST